MEETALRTCRKNKGLQLNSVVDKTGIARRTYIYYESGKRKPNIDIAQRIADALGESLETLFPRQRRTADSPRDEPQAASAAE